MLRERPIRTMDDRRLRQVSTVKRAKATLRRALLKIYRWSFPIFQRLGFHVIPNHYTQPVPDTRTLNPRLWSRESTIVGVDLQEQGQLQLLNTFHAAYAREYARLADTSPPQPYAYVQPNGLFDAVDAEVLYCMVRHFKPRRILEIGGGFSTLVAATAVRANARDGCTTTLLSVEPHPLPILSSGVPGLTEIIQKNVQDIDPALFAELGNQDILFIDSTHIVQIGSDVQFLFLEVIPRLPPGAIVHVHDIFLPAEYPREWVLEDYYFWNEQYLLQAFLAFNDTFRVLWAGGFMHLRHPDLLSTTFASYRKGVSRPGSFWFQRVA